VLTTKLDSRELKFLICQIDEYIQVTEFMIRKTSALDHGEFALARKLRTKLKANRPNIGRRTLPKSPAWTAQQIRDAFPWDEAPRYLIRVFRHIKVHHTASVMGENDEDEQHPE
jgi:hypothetical protein